MTHAMSISIIVDAMSISIKYAMSYISIIAMSISIIAMKTGSCSHQVITNITVTINQAEASAKSFTNWSYIYINAMCHKTNNR